jgi:hypothetical protein
VGFVVDSGTGHWGRFSTSTSVSPAKHSTNCSTLIIIIIIRVASVIVDWVPLHPKKQKRKILSLSVNFSYDLL